VRIDLHTHSSASDGTDTPSELMAAAAAADLDIVAITDHDSTRGWDVAAGSLPPGLTLIRGAELSCAYFAAGLDGAPGRRTSLHMLAYLFDPTAQAFIDERIRLREDRRRRGREIVERMMADGLPITWERVSELAGDGAVGRPHMARVLVEQGVVASVNEAFDKYLRDSSRYFVDKADTDVFAAIALTLASGGVAVFAHPFARARGRIVDEAVIADLAAAGLGGIEVDHPDNGPEDRDALRAIAANLGLIVTGSSDYHGTNKTTRLGAELTAPDQYERLLVAATSPTRPLMGQGAPLSEHRG
jgi:predicted metal-dependent phosphoesterase TrpH